MSSQGLSKNGKKVIVVASFTIPALIIIGVMLAGEHHGSEAADSAVQEVQLAGVPVLPPNPSIGQLIRIEHDGPQRVQVKQQMEATQ